MNHFVEAFGYGVMAGALYPFAMSVLLWRSSWFFLAGAAFLTGFVIFLAAHLAIAWLE